MSAIPRATPRAFPRIVVIADDAAFNRWLWPTVEQAAEIHALVRPNWSVSASAPRSTAASIGERLRRRLRQRYFAPRDAAHEEALATRLAPPAALAAPVLTIPVRDMNNADTVQQLAALAPDLLLVCGAPLLRPAVFECARVAALNLHLGLAPEYRGMHTLAVPWVRGDFARLGCTLHHIDEGIDRGSAVLRAAPAVTPGDDLADVEVKIARLAAREVIALIEWVASRGVDSVPGRAPCGGGELIRYHDRSVRADVRARLSGRRPSPLPERVERFYLG